MDNLGPLLMRTAPLGNNNEKIKQTIGRNLLCWMKVLCTIVNPHLKSGKEVIDDLAVEKREFLEKLFKRIVADKTGMIIIFYFSKTQLTIVERL